PAVRVRLVANVNDSAGDRNMATAFRKLDLQPDDGVDRQEVLGPEKHSSSRKIAAVRDHETVDAAILDPEDALDSLRLSRLSTGHFRTSPSSLLSGCHPALARERDALSPRRPGMRRGAYVGAPPSSQRRVSSGT